MTDREEMRQALERILGTGPAQVNQTARWQDVYPEWMTPAQHEAWQMASSTERFGLYPLTDREYEELYPESG